MSAVVAKCSAVKASNKRPIRFPGVVMWAGSQSKHEQHLRGSGLEDHIDVMATGVPGVGRLKGLEISRSP